MFLDDKNASNGIKNTNFLPRNFSSVYLPANGSSNQVEHQHQNVIDSPEINEYKVKAYILKLEDN